MIKYKQRERLIKQMEMLSEASSQGIMDDGLSTYSREMVRIYKELVHPFRTVFLGFLILDFLICFFIFIKKFGGGE